jgi:hypothetical protein
MTEYCPLLDSMHLAALHIQLFELFFDAFCQHQMPLDHRSLQMRPN